MVLLMLFLEHFVDLLVVADGGWWIERFCTPSAKFARKSLVLRILDQ